MKLHDLLLVGTLKQFEKEVIVSSLLHKDRSFLRAHPEYSCSIAEADTITEAFKRAEAGEPVAYILGKREFYGREFIVTSDVLIPRPCTEEIVSTVVDICKNSAETDTIKEVDSEVVCWSHIRSKTAVECIIDIGTGSGALAVSLALELPKLTFIATDVSPEAITIAKKNIQKYSLERTIQTVCERDFETVTKCVKPFYVVSNPPYIPVGETATEAVHNNEPHIALYSGNQGIDVLKPMLKAAIHNPNCMGWIVECKTKQPGLLIPLL